MHPFRMMEGSRQDVGLDEAGEFQIVELLVRIEIIIDENIQSDLIRCDLGRSKSLLAAINFGSRHQPVTVGIVIGEGRITPTVANGQLLGIVTFRRAGAGHQDKTENGDYGAASVHNFPLKPLACGRLP